MRQMRQKGIARGIARGIGGGLVVVMLSGCAMLDEQTGGHSGTAVGAVAGAAGGAVLGGLLFKSTTGAVIGGLVGGLAGGLIGNATEAKKQDEDATNREYGYRGNQGTVVRVAEVQAEPARIAPGGTVNLAVEYALMTPRPNEEVTIAERWNISHQGQEMGSPVHTVRHRGGTWAGSLPVTLPRSAAPGTYRVAVTIEADGRSDTRETTFTVRR